MKRQIVKLSLNGCYTLIKLINFINRALYALLTLLFKTRMSEMFISRPNNTYASHSFENKPVLEHQ